MISYSETLQDDTEQNRGQDTTVWDSSVNDLDVEDSDPTLPFELGL